MHRTRTGKSENSPVPKLITGAFGALAGAASVFGNTPVDVVKTRMQVCVCVKKSLKTKFSNRFILLKGLDAAKYKNTLDCALQIAKNEGIFA